MDGGKDSLNLATTKCGREVMKAPDEFTIPANVTTLAVTR